MFLHVRKRATLKASGHLRNRIKYKAVFVGGVEEFVL